ncbi:3-hydroxyacyl-CoA dehydrogenase/enoyl-CoA hydratase family protein [Methylonatrum kenyense]|uniref:3-hydroxyacyl-CoA dehydrogenase/enoyl-CoA hydratase family protein n=1 Tax=Methylonatrum kenyense TaxID=455253 RepID=UPI0020C180C6|nr:3-hydroxyacyl-CoA dehydrogenase/enoyl-CoA hydratase family protein [Methylonatrum kenyense]MCK8514912.1 3-hydroxyacyl-CoA dehydrogenase/enoyl-CoA hydratase family protein [Methylonatrum kenyense]
MQNTLPIRRVAVLGAGVMGAQIAAHCANCGLDTVLLELPAEGNDPDARAREAVQQLAGMRPAPLATAGCADRIHAASYDTGLPLLAGCDLVIEAIAERDDLKAALYQRVVPHLADHALFASNTSGLSIDGLATHLPEMVRNRFCGVHFFNPPRYMALVELIPGSATDGSVLDGLETFLTSVLGKDVVRANDTPNFIGNRVGLFSLMASVWHGRRLGLSPDLVDALTGPLIGRPKSGTYRTADVVGLDTMVHVVEGPVPRLQHDPWVRCLQLPDWIHELIAQGRLGAKSGAGVYRKGADGIEVYDPELGDYRAQAAQVSPAVQEVLAIAEPAERWRRLREMEDDQARFLWAVHRELFLYAAWTLAEIAPSAAEVDRALRNGFAWREGPFEIWQSIGWQTVAEWLREDEEGIADVELPGWVRQVSAVHGPEGSWSASENRWRARSDLPVYRRQAFPSRLRGEPAAQSGAVCAETAAVRLWHRDPEVGILSFLSKGNSCSQAVLDGIQELLERAEREYRGLVIWQPSGHFSVGADLKAVLAAARAGDQPAIERFIRGFQQAGQAIRDVRIPVVAAVRGMALGGGCELLLHCDRAVVHQEANIGLVEAAVGVIPAGRGCTMLAARAQRAGPGRRPADVAQAYFRTLSAARRSTSALEARDLGLLPECSQIVAHRDELLHVAETQARAAAESGYVPPAFGRIRAQGRDLLRKLVQELELGHEQGRLSDHDLAIGTRSATAICGGDVAPDSLLPETHFMDLELEGFLALAAMPATQDRIEHMLRTGKPLRN